MECKLYFGERVQERLDVSIGKPVQPIRVGIYKIY
jgi:hypothetical protein